MVQNGVRTILIGKRRGFCCLKKERKEGLWVVVAQSAVQSTKCKFHKFKLCYYQTSGGREHEFPHRQVCSWGQPCSFPGENRSLKKKKQTTEEGIHLPIQILFLFHALFVVFSSFSKCVTQSRSEQISRTAQDERRVTPIMRNYISQKSLKENDSLNFIYLTISHVYSSRHLHHTYSL